MGWACECGDIEPGCVWGGEPVWARLSPSRDSLEPSPGAGLLNLSGALAEGATLVFGGWVLISVSPAKAPASCLSSCHFCSLGKWLVLKTWDTLGSYSTSLVARSRNLGEGVAGR